MRSGDPEQPEAPGGGEAGGAAAGEAGGAAAGEAGREVPAGRSQGRWPNQAAAVLGQARRRAGMTQADLAARAGTTQSAISAYESGARQPALDTLQRLVGAAGFDVELAVRERRSDTSRLDTLRRIQDQPLALTIPLKLNGLVATHVVEELEPGPLRLVVGEPPGGSADLGAVRSAQFMLSRGSRFDVELLLGRPFQSIVQAPQEGRGPD